MARYTSCARCGNSEPGDKIWSCDDHGAYCTSCSQGTWSGGLECPQCEYGKFANGQFLGKIEEDD